MNMPKLVGEDVQLFLSVLSDLFPGAEIPEVVTGALQVAIEVLLAHDKPQPVCEKLGTVCFAHICYLPFFPNSKVVGARNSSFVIFVKLDRSISDPCELHIHKNGGLQNVQQIIAHSFLRAQCTPDMSAPPLLVLIFG